MSLWKYCFGHAYNFGKCSGIDWFSMEQIGLVMSLTRPGGSLCSSDQQFVVVLKIRFL